jgi:hypothetical protein
LTRGIAGGQLAPHRQRLDRQLFYPSSLPASPCRGVAGRADGGDAAHSGVHANRLEPHATATFAKEIVIQLYHLKHVPWLESQLIYHAQPRVAVQGLNILARRFARGAGRVRERIDV